MATTKLLLERICVRPPNPRGPTVASSFSGQQHTHLTTLGFSPYRRSTATVLLRGQRKLSSMVVSAAGALQPLDLTEENIEKVLEDARTELAQLFDASVGITGQAELAELDGPFVKIRLRGRFWHMRSTVLARLDNYLKQRIPEILEVDIEDEKQLDDSPDNF